MTDEERTTFFDVYGPFPVARHEGLYTSRQSAFWASAEDEAARGAAGLSQAVGCYMFCLKHGSSIRPWYVGMTVAQDGYKGEVFERHKLKIYNEVHGGRRGTGVMFLFPLHTPSGRFSRGASNKPVVLWLERYLMMSAYARNPDITNIRDMRHLRDVQVLGVLGKAKGRPHREVTDVRRALFGSPNRMDD